MDLFDFAEAFDKDYLHFYMQHLTDELSDKQTELIWALLELKEGDSVLDLPCGHGRIANRLARAGFEVTGIDLSPLFVDVAKREAAEWSVNVAYAVGDMREIDFESRFDAVLNWYTAFGYFCDDDGKEVLRRIFRALKPGGRFALDHINLARMLREKRESSVTELGEDLLIDVQHPFDALNGVIRSERMVVRNGKTRKFKLDIRVFMPTEIAHWLREAGFVDVRVVDQEGAPMSMESRRMVVLARKPM